MSNNFESKACLNSIAELSIVLGRFHPEVDIMKKMILISLSILIIFFLVIVFGVTNDWFGLFHNSTDDNTVNYSFIGMWEVNHSWYENGTKIDEWTYDMAFYENGTSKFETQNHSQITWEPYIFKNNHICYEDEENDICYIIEYQDSGNTMILTATITNEYGDILVVRECKRK